MTSTTPRVLLVNTGQGTMELKRPGLVHLFPVEYSGNYLITVKYGYDLLLVIEAEDLLCSEFNIHLSNTKILLDNRSSMPSITPEKLVDDSRHCLFEIAAKRFSPDGRTLQTHYEFDDCQFTMTTRNSDIIFTSLNRMINWNRQTY